MPYIGNDLATQFQAFATQTITGDGSTGYTLDRAVANGKELLVYINNVKQEEGSGKSYEASGTTITFSEAVASGDSCYLVYMGSAQQTVTAPSGSIVSGQIANANLVMPNTLDMNGNELILDADADTSIQAGSDDVISIKTAGGERLTIQADGDTQIIGTTANAISGGDGQLRIRLAATRASGEGPFIGFDVPRYTGDANTEDMGAIGFVASDGTNNSRKADFVLHTRDTSRAERMRITSDGILLLGNTTTSDTSGIGFKARPTGSITGTFNTSASDTSGFHYYNTNGTNNGYRFYVRADGGIYNYSSANFNLSDEREKKNIADMGSHYEDFKKFKFRDFNYNTEEDSQPKKHGVIAQEVELVNSNLVGEDFKVKVDEDGKDVLRKGLKEEQFVMIGLKTLQETIVKLEGALARIDTLEAEVAKLKG